jgi:hypothetical protein
MNKFVLDSGPNPAHFGRDKGGGGLDPAEPYASYAPGSSLFHYPEG